MVGARHLSTLHPFSLGTLAQPSAEEQQAKPTLSPAQLTVLPALPQAQRNHGWSCEQGNPALGMGGCWASGERQSHPAGGGGIPHRAQKEAGEGAAFSSSVCGTERLVAGLLYLLVHPQG